MIPKDCKRLAEVDFPIAVVSKHSAREKSIRHGHPSTLHLWWARRPLAACRAMLLALLLPDPCDEHCPEDFKEKARALLAQVQGKSGTKDEDLRQALHKFIGDFANWDLSSNQTYLDVSRGLVNAAHPEETPLVVDPFAGGGSIPLEALRLGCDAFASDLNPVACLIEKVMLEDIPRHGPKLADELRQMGAEIKAAAEKELAEFYPPDPDGARPIAYLWARTVRCEAPNCGAEIPIFKTAWLSKKGARRAKYFRESADGRSVGLLIESSPIGGPITLRVARGDGSETERAGFHLLRATKAPGGNNKVICPCCGTVVAGERVMSQLRAQAGGCNVLFDQDGHRKGGAFLLAVLVRDKDGSSRRFRLAGQQDYVAVWRASIRANSDPVFMPPGEINPVRPSPNARGLTAPTRYGANRFQDLFTARQRVALGTLARLTRLTSNPPKHSRAVGSAAALAVGRCANQSSAHVRWIANIEAIGDSFPRQALQMVWDFVESVPTGDESANFGAAIDWIIKVIERQGTARLNSATVEQSDAAALPLPDDSASVWFTDPPYYDAVPYADLSDFFWIWLRPALPLERLRSLRSNENDALTPKLEESIWHAGYKVAGKPKDPAFFEHSMSLAFRQARRALSLDGIGCVVFAHKSTEGWEALLGGLLAGGWVVVASWPVVTERGVRTNAQNTASLASSIHLIVRPRTGEEVGDWTNVLRELPARVGDWMERLQAEHVRGADLVFACIGPALEIFSRYSHVETADGREVPLAEYLEKVWEVVGRTALEQILGTAEAKARNGAAGALEEDARLTALFLWTLQSTNGNGTNAKEGETGDNNDDAEEDEEAASGSKKAGYTLIYDVARRFAQPLGIHLDVWEGRIIETEKGVVRLLPVHERAKQLFGEGGAQSIAEQIERNPVGSQQLGLFPDEEAPKVKGKKGKKGKTTVELSDEAIEDRRREATTLDRIHAAMLLQAGGRTNALRALLKAEQERGPDFLRLANALSALYPRDSEEKRLLDAMLLAVPR